MIIVSHIFNNSISNFDIKDKSLRYQKKKGKSSIDIIGIIIDIRYDDNKICKIFSPSNII